MVRIGCALEVATSPRSVDCRAVANILVDQPRPVSFPVMNNTEAEADTGGHRIGSAKTQSGCLAKRREELALHHAGGPVDRRSTRGWPNVAHNWVCRVPRQVSETPSYLAFTAVSILWPPAAWCPRGRDNGQGQRGLRIESLTRFISLFL